MQITWYMKWHNRFWICCNMTVCAVDKYACQWFQNMIYSNSDVHVLNNARVFGIILSKGWAVEKAFFFATVHFRFVMEQFIMNHDSGLYYVGSNMMSSQINTQCTLRKRSLLYCGLVLCTTPTCSSTFTTVSSLIFVC